MSKSLKLLQDIIGDCPYFPEKAGICKQESI